MTIIPSALNIPKLKLNSLSRNKPDNLTKNNTTRPPSYSNLSHTFRAFHTNTEKEKNSQVNHLFDLQNTFDLSIQMIEAIFPTTKVKQEDRAMIKKGIKKIKEIYQKKKQLNKEKAKIRSKILVDHQVSEEAKRRKEENANYYQDQIEGIEENIDKKSTFIKKFYKKFNEVEIFIHRECQASAKYRAAFAEYEINPFLYSNETYLREKKEYQKAIKGLNHDIKIIIKENIELKKREELISEENETESDKYAELIQSYNSKILYFKSTNMHLKASLRNLINQIKMKNIQKNLIDAYQEFEEGTAKQTNDNDNEEDEKKNNNNNINININVNINNNSFNFNTNAIKGSIEDGWTNNIQSKILKNSAIGWDISCIEKTDEN